MYIICVGFVLNVKELRALLRKLAGDFELVLNFFEPLGSSVSGSCGFGARHGSHHRQKQGLVMSQSEDLESRPSPYEKNKKT